VQRIEAENIRVVKLPEIRERMQAIAVEPVGNTSKEFAKIVADDLTRWNDVAKAANIKLSQ
jgi:tripartite-type tricarboxylate transporter receptor subunit TctC